MCVAFKMGFIFSTFTGTPLTLTFHLSHVYNVQMQQKKMPLRGLDSHTEQGFSQWRASAVQKGLHRKVLGHNPKKKFSSESEFIKHPHTLYTHKFIINISCDFGKIYNADGNLCSFIQLFMFYHLYMNIYMIKHLLYILILSMIVVLEVL